MLIAGPSYMPAAYRDTPLARLLPFAAESVRYPDPAAVLSEGFVVQPTELGLASPAMQLGDTPEETQAIWRHLPPLYWLLEVPELKPGVRVLAEHPTRVGPDGRHLPVFCLAVRGGGQGAVPRHRRDVALALSGGRRVLRPLLGADHPLPLPREAGRRRPPGHADRPIAASMPRASRCGCGCASPTSGWPRPRTTA